MTVDKVFRELSAVAKIVCMQLEESAGVETAAASAYSAGISQLYLLLRAMQLEAWALEDAMQSAIVRLEERAVSN